MRTLYPVDKTTRKKMWKKKQKNKMEIRQKFKGRDVQESKTILVNINSTLALHNTLTDRTALHRHKVVCRHTWKWISSRRKLQYVSAGHIYVCQQCRSSVFMVRNA